MGSRRKGREFALQMLYNADLVGCSLQEVFRTFWRGIAFQDDERAFAEQIAQGVLRDLDDIDQLIETHSLHWKIARMPLVDRNILRMGVFELTRMRDIPSRVTINEAIELGKRYSTDESGAFINGVLDKIAHSLPTAKRPPQASALFSEGDYLEVEDE